MFSFSVSCYVSKYIESVSVLWSIFSWPFALHGKWENEVNECDIKCLLRLSKVIIDIGNESYFIIFTRTNVINKYKPCLCLQRRSMGLSSLLFTIDVFAPALRTRFMASRFLEFILPWQSKCRRVFPSLSCTSTASDLFPSRKNWKISKLPVFQSKEKKKTNFYQATRESYLVTNI